MLSKCASLTFLLLLCALIAPAFSSPNYRQFCPQCEEEVWEEVPCNQISTTTTTTTARPPSTTTYESTTQRPATTSRPYTKPQPTQAPVAYSTTTAAPITSTTPSAYQNCYCECKGGCKEFCRKVTVNGASEKQIIQITKTSHRVPNGQLNSEHVHQHIFVPNPQVTYTPAPPIAQPNAVQDIYRPAAISELGSSYGHAQLAYKIQPPQPLQPTLPATYAPASQPPSIYETSKSDNTYSEAMLDASYTIDELTRLLQMETLNRNSATAYYQPAVYAPALASHADEPPYTMQPASPYNLPLPEPKYSPSASSGDITNTNYPVIPKYKTAAESSSATPSPAKARPSGFSATQYTNYISKGYSNGPAQHRVASESNKDQQSEPSVDSYATYSSPNGEFHNSMPYNSLADEYAPRLQPYAM